MAGDRSNLVRAVTPLGRAVIAAVPLAWAAAWLTGWSELAYVAGTALVAVLSAVVLSLGRSDFDVHLRLEPARVTAGDPAGGELIVENLGRRRSAPVTLELAVGRANRRVRLPMLAPGAEFDELVRIPTRRRSIIRFGPVEAVRGDPVGLIRRSRAWPDFTDLYVHPRISTLDRLGAGFLRDLEGRTTQDLSPSDVAFHTLREYVPGDDLRHVHWKTTARIGTLMVRQFVDTRRSTLAVGLATDPSEFDEEDEFELAVSVAASLAVRALRDDQTVRFVAGDAEVPVSSPVALLDSCSGLESTPGRGRLDEVVVLVNKVAPDASIVLLGVGSSVPVASVRGAVARLKPDARVIVVRCTPTGRPTAHRFGNVTLLDVPDLEEFGRIMFQLSTT